MMISRIRAQVGGPVHELYGVMPDVTLETALGARGLGRRTLGMFAMLSFYLTGDQENAPTPIQLETLKLAEGGRMERPRIAVALALVVPLTIVCSFWAYVHFGYQLGIGTPEASRNHVWVSRATAELLDSKLRQPEPINPGETIAMGFGGVLTVLLLFLKLRFPWWPLHPIALSIANSWMMHYLTVVLLATWWIKALILRYGGLRAYRVALPLFLGLLVGNLLSYMLGAVSDLLFHTGSW